MPAGMGKNKSSRALAAAILIAIVVGCEGDGGNDGRDGFLGAWFPCVDESCAQFGEEGIAFVGERWFYRATYQAPVEPGGAPVFSFDDRECCWSVDGGDLILDLGDSYQTLEIRLEGDDVLQVERLSYDVLDTETQEWSLHECVEGEAFEVPDGGEEEEEDPDAWTPEACWTERWAPIGRARRLLDRVEVKILTFDPEDHYEQF